MEKTGSEGNVDTYTVTYTDGSTYTFTVTNGQNGTDGQNGVGIERIAKTGTRAHVVTFLYRDIALFEP